MFPHFSVVFALVAFANAAALPATPLFGIKSLSVSSTCLSGALGLIASPVSTCLNLAGVIPLVTAPPTSPIIPFVMKYQEGLCAAPECTAADIKTAVSTLAKSCTAELAERKMSEEQAITLAQDVIPAAKKILCLRDPSANPPSTPCLKSFLEAAQGAAVAPEQLTKENALKVYRSFTSDPAKAEALKKAVATKCSACFKEANKIVWEVIASVMNPAIRARAHAHA